MASKNRVQLGGNLTKDPEIRTTQGGIKVTDFTLAVTRPTAQGKDNGTDYFQVAAFGRLAELVAEHKKKGHAVVVEGSISYSAWEDRETNEKRSAVRVKADDVQFVDTIGNGVNHVLILGNLTRDPQSRVVDTQSESGVPVCSFGLAMNRVHSAKEDAVDFVDVDVWREQGEAVQAHKKKGEGVMVEGRLQYDVWEAEDGSPRSKVKVVADSVQFTTPKKGAANATSTQSSAERPHRSGHGPSHGQGSNQKSAYAGRSASAPANAPDEGATPITKAQKARLERDAVEIGGENGIAGLEARLGKKLADLTKEEATAHIGTIETARRGTAQVS